MSKNKLLILASILFILVSATAIVIDNIPRDYRNQNKLEEYELMKNSVISQYRDIYDKLQISPSDNVEWTRDELLETNELFEALSVKCTSVEELREYVVMSNRKARRTKRELQQKSKSSHRQDDECIYFISW